MEGIYEMTRTEIDRTNLWPYAHKSLQWLHQFSDDGEYHYHLHEVETLLQLTEKMLMFERIRND